MQWQEIKDYLESRWCKISLDESIIAKGRFKIDGWTKVKSSKEIYGEAI